MISQRLLVAFFALLSNSYGAVLGATCAFLPTAGSARIPRPSQVSHAFVDSLNDPDAIDLALRLAPVSLQQWIASHAETPVSGALTPTVLDLQDGLAFVLAVQRYLAAIVVLESPTDHPSFPKQYLVTLRDELPRLSHDIRKIASAAAARERSMRKQNGDEGAGSLVESLNRADMTSPHQIRMLRRSGIDRIREILQDLGMSETSDGKRLLAALQGLGQAKDRQDVLVAAQGVLKTVYRRTIQEIDPSCEVVVGL